jgi:hypothetical protein
MRTRKEEIFLEAYSIRVNIIQKLASLKRGDNVEPVLGEVVNGIDKIIELLGDNPINTSYQIFRHLVIASQNLAKWENGVKNAEIDADRFHRAYEYYIGEAKMMGANYPISGLNNIIGQISGVNELDKIEAAMKCLGNLSLPLPIHKVKNERDSHFSRTSVKSKKETEVIAFAEFQIDKQELQDPHIVQPAKLYDLSIKLRLGSWPLEADKLTLEPISVESPDLYSMPTFEFVKDESVAINESTKKMRISAEQTFESEPMEFVYQAYFSPKQDSVFLTGNRLKIRSVSENPVISGYAQGDVKLKQVQALLSSEKEISGEDKRNFLAIMKNLVNIAGQSLAHNDFGGEWDEKRFQNELGRRLRSVPEIGSNLQEHSHIAGGITDLIFKKIQIELKVEKNKEVACENALNYSQQASQYTTGCDTRLGILCILDASVKTHAPASLTNDIDYKKIPVPGTSIEGFPLILGIVIIRGNLSTPSSLKS